jgi:phosphatidylethanolamine/phosphatidyl-N-methylethanolamine N-methyltransferase
MGPLGELHSIGADRMALQLKQKLSEKFEADIRFFKGWLDGPKTVGTPFATSVHTGRAMASVINVNSGLPVLEVGPGTGTITSEILARGIAPENLYAVEYSQDFASGLRAAFPGVHFIHGDIFQLDYLLGKKRGLVFDCVISAIPLLNVPLTRRVAYLEDMLNRIPPGRPVIQVTYSPVSPVPPRSGSFTVARADFILRNVPPAHLWTYRRAAG